MIRYEFEAATTNWCKYRFKRVELNLHVQEVFQFKPTFNLSKKVNGLFNVQIATKLIDIRGLKIGPGR